MFEKQEKYKIVNALIVPLIMLLIMWCVKGFEELFDIHLGRYGIEPLTLKGLRGILFSPFLHSDWKHLISNSVPFLVLGTTLYYFYHPIANKVLLFSALMTGLWTWAGARTGIHIGASGLVYSLAFFLMFSGFIRRDGRLMAISFIVIFLYGSLIWGVFPEFYAERNISWEGHLSGFLSGVILAVFYRKVGTPPRKKYSWEDEEEEDVEKEESENRAIDEEPSEKPYWDIPEPDKKDLTVVYRFRKSNRTD
ncbi:MAG: rhomboid family intramembrane serine protease [Lentimicrobiaceae bacterium]|jgi:membrane associated rhomboid family serine protease|nr:rhomboid family intramembrane serine protease [Lentimicrobiaceae bacterium]